MTVTVTINQTWRYFIEASSVRVAIAKACTQHDVFAKARQKQGLLTPQTLSQAARKGGVRIHADVLRNVPEGEETAKKVKRVKRGPIR
jgi:hypothetical protein